MGMDMVDIMEEVEGNWMRKRAGVSGLRAWSIDLLLHAGFLLLLRFFSYDLCLMGFCVCGVVFFLF
ncbi:hypothetical protein BDZ91DRAFT_745572 [Kalaharituber pfeilii]|nr:hypothetical protein BDZ91DRAFT_745572 [Kalaharituber pfeilii]